MALLVSTFAMTLIVQAEDTPALEADVIYTISTKEAESIAAGEEFTIDISTSEVADIASIELRLGYDKAKFEYVSGEIKGYLLNMSMKGIKIPAKPTQDVLGELWITGMEMDALAGEQDEVIATLTFKALVDITEDSVMTVVKAPIAQMLDMTEYVTAVVDGGVKIVAAEETTTTTTEAPVTETTTSEAPTTTSTRFVCYNHEDADGDSHCDYCGEPMEIVTTTEAPVTETTTEAPVTETTTEAPVTETTTEAPVTETTTEAPTTTTEPIPEGALVYTISTYEAQAIATGDTFTIELSTNEVSDIAMVEFKLGYDQTKFEYVEGTVQGYLAEMDMKGIKVPTNPAQQELGELWITGMGASQVGAEGEVIATLTFKALVDITEDSEMIVVKTPLAQTEAMEDIVTFTVKGGVKIVEAPVTETTTVEEETTTTLEEETTTTVEEETTTTTEPTTTTTTEPLPEGTIAYMVSTYEADSMAAGDTFTIELSTSAVADIAMVEFKLGYDKTKFEYVEGTVQGYLAEMDMKGIKVPAKPVQEELGELWITGMGASQVGADGEVIATLTFKALADITEGSKITAVKTPLASAGNETEYDIVVRDGGVKIAGADIPTTTTTEVTTTTTEPTTTTTEPLPEGTVAYMVSTYTADAVAAGDEFTIEIATSTLTDIACVEFKLGYDKTKFEFVSGELSGYVASMDMNGLKVPAKPVQEELGELWITGMHNEALTGAEGEVIATLTFKALVDLTENSKITAVKTPLALRMDQSEYDVIVRDGGVKLNGVDDPIVCPGHVDADNNGICDTCGETVPVQVTTTTTVITTTTTLDGGETTTTAVDGGETTTTTDAAATTTTTDAAVTTTTTNAPATTTTKAGVDDVEKPDMPKTADVSEVTLYVIVAGLAAVAVVLTSTVLKRAAR